MRRVTTIVIQGAIARGGDVEDPVACQLMRLSGLARATRARYRKRKKNFKERPWTCQLISEPADLYTYDIPLTVTAFEAGLRRL